VNLYTLPANDQQEYYSLQLAADAENVYWLRSEDLGLDQSGPGQVLQMPLSGGTAQTILTGINEPGNIAVANGTLYYFDEWQTTFGSLKSVPIGGGQVATLVTGLPYPAFLCVDAMGANAYWATDGEAVGPIYRLSLAGGTLTTLASENFPGDLAINASTVLWTTSDGLVEAVPVSGGSVLTLASGGTGPSGPNQIVADASNVYWSEVNGSLVKQSLSGGGPVTLTGAQPDTTNVVKILLDGDNLYWLSMGALISSNFVGRVPITGGTAVTLNASEYLDDFVVEGQSIYLFSLSRIDRLTPK
jgi:hypothetical protein